MSRVSPIGWRSITHIVLHSKHSDLRGDSSTRKEIVSQSNQCATVLFYFPVNLAEDILPSPRSYNSHVYNYQGERPGRLTDLHMLCIQFDKFSDFGDALEHFFKYFCLPGLRDDVPQSVGIFRKFKPIPYRHE